MELTVETLVRFHLVGDDVPAFRAAMAKLYAEVNAVGFGKRLGLSKDERAVFNDVVEQLSIQNMEDESDT